MIILTRKAVSIYFGLFVLLALFNGCRKEDNMIPLYINNLKIEGIDRESSCRNFKAKYKDYQTLECEIESLFLVKSDLKITGIGAFYDGSINLRMDTNRAWVEEEYTIIRYKISFELYGAGLNGRKCNFKLTLDNEEILFEVD